MGLKRKICKQCKERKPIGRTKKCCARCRRINSKALRPLKPPQLPNSPKKSYGSCSRCGKYKFIGEGETCIPCRRAVQSPPLPYARDTYAQRDAILRGMGYNNYGEYLASELWAEIRAGCLDAHNHACILCSAWTNTVHHRRYTEAVLRGEDLSQLVPLCSTCHEKVEFKVVKRSLAEAQDVFDTLLQASIIRKHLDAKVL